MLSSSTTWAQDPWEDDWDLVFPPMASDDLGVADPSSSLSILDFGDLDDDPALDAIMMMANQKVYFCGSIAVFGQPELLAVSATGVVVQNGRGSSVDDVVLVATSSGLAEYAYDAGTESWASPVSVLSTTAIQGASKLVCADLNNTGADDLIFVSSQNAKRLIAYNAESTGGFESTPFFDLTLARTPQEILVLDWDGDSSNDIAVRTNTSIEIYDQDENLIQSWASLAPGDAIAVLAATPTQGDDRLLWARRDVTDSYHDLLVLHYNTPNPTGEKLEFHLDGDDTGDPTPIDVTGLAVADGDGDGDRDLLVFNSTWSAVAAVGNRGTSVPAFGRTTLDYRLLALADDPEASPGTDFDLPGCFVDVNNDGNADLIQYDAGNDMLVFDCGAPDFAGTIPLDPEEYDFYDGIEYGFSALGETFEGPYRVRFDAPEFLVADPDFTFLQFAVWKQDNPPNAPANASVANYFYPLDPDYEGPKGQVEIVVPDDGMATPHFDLPADQEDWTEDLHYYFAVRWVEVLDPDLPNLHVEDGTSWFLNVNVGDDDLEDDTDDYVDYIVDTLMSMDTMDVLSFNSDPGGTVPLPSVLGLAGCVSRVGSFSSPGGPTFSTEIERDEGEIGYWTEE